MVTGDGDCDCDGDDGDEGGIISGVCSDGGGGGALLVGCF